MVFDNLRADQFITHDNPGRVPFYGSWEANVVDDLKVELMISQVTSVSTISFGWNIFIYLMPTLDDLEFSGDIFL